MAGMSKEPELAKVMHLSPTSRRVNIVVKVVEIGEEREVTFRSDGSKHRVAEALVGDETGSILLTLWDDMIERLEVGNVYRIENGYVSVFRDQMRLNIGRYGSASPVGREGFPEVNTKNNLSERTVGGPLYGGYTRRY